MRPATRRRGRPVAGSAPDRRARLGDDAPSWRRRSPGRPRRARAACSACRRRHGRVPTRRRRTAAARPGVAPRRSTVPAGLDAVGERAERVRRTAVVRRHGVGPQPDPGDDAERALRPEEQLVEVGPDGGGRRAAGAHDGAVGEHDLEADDDVLDLAVAGRVLAGAAAGDPAADRGDVEALREVPDAEPVARCSSASRSGPNVPASTSTTPDVASTATMPASAGGVEHHAAEHRHRRAAHAAAAAGDGEREVVVGARPHHGGDLVGRGRAGRRRRPLRAPRRPSDQCSASGHQSRLASATAGSSSTTGADRGRRLVDARAAGTSTARDQRGARRRSARSVASARSSGACGGPPGVGLLGGARARGRPRPGGQSRASSQPSSPASSSATRAPRSSVAGRSNRWARVRRRSTSSSVVAISWRAAYTASARRYGQARARAARRASGRRRRAPRPRRRACRSARRGGRRATRRAGSWYPSAPSRRQPLGAAAGLASEPLEHGVDGVLGHLPVRRQLAAGDADDAGRADRHAVAPGQVGRPSARRRLDERPEPGPHAGDVVDA